MKKAAQVSFSKLVFSLFFWCIVLKGNTQNYFFCYIAPKDTITAKFGVAGDSTGCPLGYRLIEITDRNKANFDRSAPQYLKYIYNQLQGTKPLRKNVNLVGKNSAGKVTQVVYYLIDDRTGLSASPADTNHVFLPYKHNGMTYAWPAAFTNKNKRRPGKYAGWVMVGEHQLQTDQSNRIGRMSAMEELVLHETSHTQLTGRSSKWGVGGINISYGMDKNHYTTEILGDQAIAMNEGIATFYGFVMNDSGYQQLVTFLTRTDQRYFVEAKSVMGGNNELFKLRKQARFDTLLNADYSVKQYDDGKPVTAFHFDWRTIPGWYLLFAEGTSTAFFSLFRNHTYSNKDTSYAMIRRTTTDMSTDYRKRALTYCCNQLALKMEAYNESRKPPTGNDRISSMFPFAVLDLLTHFGMTDTAYKADLRRSNPEKLSKASEAYWEIRNVVKELVRTDIDASPIRFMDAMKKLEDFFRKPETILPAD